MDNLQKVKFDDFMNQLNEVMIEHTKLLKNALSLYEEFSSESLIDPSESNKKKLDHMKDVLIALTYCGTNLLKVTNFNVK